MKRLTTLAVLVGALFMMPLHAEDTSIESLLKLNEPAETPPVPPPGAPVFIPSVVNSISIAQMGFPEGISLTGGSSRGGRPLPCLWTRSSPRRGLN